MYYVYYGNELIYDPIDDQLSITDTKCSGGLNTYGTFEFTILWKHPYFDKLALRDELVKLYWDNKPIFMGFIANISVNMEMEKRITVNGDLAFLGDTHVPPYTTAVNEEPSTDVPNDMEIITAPANFGALFRFYIEQHNLHSTYHFSIGINEGDLLDTGNTTHYRASSQWPTTADEIQEKLLDSIGGYIRIRYGENGERLIDYLSQAQDVNAQLIDFGENLLDYSQDTSVSDVYTVVQATGATLNIDAQGHVIDDDDTETEVDHTHTVTLRDLNDYVMYGGLLKVGDYLEDRDAVLRYGKKELIVSNDYYKDAEDLALYASLQLRLASKPSSNIDIRAIDMALYTKGYTHLAVGDLVRVRSDLHKVDEYMMVQEIDLDLGNPENTTYALGVPVDYLTGDTISRVSALNSNINSAVDAVAAIDQSVVQAAKDAAEAKATASDAVVSSELWYYNSDSPTELTGGNWSQSNVWVDGKYLWQRTKVIFGNGTWEWQPSETGVCVKGNTGQQGEQGPRGLPGEPGITTYIWIRYSEDASGADMHAVATDDDKYMGVYSGSSDTAPSTPSSYTWSLIQGAPEVDPEELVPLINEAVGTEVAKIEIGSRNWLRESRTPGITTFYQTDSTEYQPTGGVTDPWNLNNAISIPTSAWSVKSPASASWNPITMDDTYTFSVWLKADTEKTITPTINGVTLSAWTVGNTWKRYRTTTKITGHPTDASTSVPLTLSAASNGFYLAYPKLELGTLASDWTKAPEDDEAATAAIGTKIDTVAEQSLTKTDAENTYLSKTDANTAFVTRDATDQQIQTDVDAMRSLINAITTWQNTASQWITFESGTGLVFHAGQNIASAGEKPVYEYELTITGEGIQMRNSGGSIMSLKAEILSIASELISDQLQVGGYMWKARSDGSMYLKWVGLPST